MSVRLNKAYLIIGLTAIFVLAAMLSGPLIRKRARERARQSQTAPTTQQSAGTPRPDGNR